MGAQQARRQLTCPLAGGRVAAATAGVLLDVEALAPATTAQSVRLVVATTEAARALAALAHCDGCIREGKNWMAAETDEAHAGTIRPKPCNFIVQYCRLA